MFFMEDGEYKFDARKLEHAHSWCQTIVGGWMSDGEERIVVSNTFTQEWEMMPYLDWAEDFGYKVFVLIVENRHGGVSGHNVPEKTLFKMRQRFEVQL